MSETEIERAAEQFFARWMPVYAMIVCLVGMLFLLVMGLGVLAGMLR